MATVGKLSGGTVTPAEIKASLNKAIRLLGKKHLGANSMHGNINSHNGFREKTQEFNGSNGHASFSITLSENVMTTVRTIS